MKNIKIVEYKPSYAKSVADMWRRSAEGWGGNFSDESEESVLRQNENNTDINTYLALLGDDIVGYCGLSEYTYDEKSLYIRLLNVRYDLHGKGIGRTLVCKAIERTKELEWPRVDLYTWPGNTKSVPLYKRCGFFYEKREDSTHLMNFIPGVLNSEAFKEYFENVHWYKDMKRTIDIEPDGIKDNGFTFYEYLWEKDGQPLRIQFENKSRGMSLIETNDYLIKTSLPEQKLIFGQNYNIKYEIINKSKNPLNISIKGKNNKNIEYSFNKTTSVNGKKIIEGKFLVKSTLEKTGLFNTYPSVISEIFINGKKLEFKIGVDTQYPANISLSLSPNECYKNITSTMYLDIENKYKENAIFKFELPENKDIKFINKNINIEMKPNEKKSIKLQYTLNNFTFYNELIKVTAQLKERKDIIFEKQISTALIGRNGMFGGQAEDYYMIVNGPYSVKLSQQNELFLQTFGAYMNNNYIDFPMLGKPFSEEFSNKKPESIEHYIENDNIVLKAIYASEAFKNIKVASIIKLSQTGIAEHHYEIYNNSDYESSKEICLCQNVTININKCIIPYKNKFIQIPDTKLINLESLDAKNITENWIYISAFSKNFGLCWHKNLNVKNSNNSMIFEHNLGKMAAKEKRVTESIYMSLNTFNNWKEFRSFAMKNNDNTANLILDNNFGMIINNGNPFVKDNIPLKIKQYFELPLKGKYSVNSKNFNFEEINQNFKSEDNTFEKEFDITMNKNIDRDIISLEADSDITYSNENKMVFKISDNACESNIIKEQGHKVYSISNGIMKIKACPSFSNTLYSLEYNNHQWLESSFPTPRPKSWFNPWFGGIGMFLDNLSFRSILEQNISAEFVQIEDNFKNHWHGIKVKVILEKHDSLEGLEINQYFLVLPGIPILCTTSEIVQNTRKFIASENLNNFSFFNFDKDIKNNWIKLKDLEGNFHKHKVGISAEDIIVTSSILYGSNTLKDKIQLYTNLDESTCIGFINMNDDAAIVIRNISLEDGSKMFTSPEFYIFTEDYIEGNLLKDLRNISFN